MKFRKIKINDLNVFLLLLFLNFIIFAQYILTPGYNIMGETDPNPVLILNPKKEVDLHIWKWTESWNLGGNTNWQTGKVLLGVIFYIINFLVEIKSRFLFEIFFLTISGFGMYLFTREYIFNKNKIVSLFSGLIYIYNPFTAIWLERSVLVLFPYLVFPYLIKIIFEVLHSNEIKLKHIFYSIILFNFVSLSLNPGALGIMLLSISIFIVFQRQTYNNIYKLTFIFIIGMLSTLWSLLPVILHEFLYKDMIQKLLALQRMHSRGTSIITSLTMTNLWEFTAKSDNIPYFPFYERYNSRLLLMLPITAIASIFFYKRAKKIILPIYFLFTLGIFLSLSDAPTTPYRDIFVWLETNTIYGIFRNNFKFSHMILITYSILIPYTLSQSIEHVNKKQKFVVVIYGIVLLCLLMGPFVLGELHKKQFTGFPSDLYTVAEIINKDRDGGRVLLVPGQHLEHYIFHRVYVDRPILFALINSPVIFQDTGRYPYDIAISQNILYIYEKLLNYDINKFTILLNIKYVVIDKTLNLKYEHNLNPIEFRMKKNYNILENYFEQNYSRVYKSNNYTLFYYSNASNNFDIFKIPDEVIVTGGESINPKYINNIPSNIAIIDLEKDKLNIIRYTNLILEKDLFIKFLLINTMNSPIGFSQNNGWYKVATNSRPIDISKYEYGFGAISTYNPRSKTSATVDITKPDKYILFINYFKNKKGGELKIQIDNITIKIKTQDQLNKFVWKDLGTFYLKEGKHEIILENVRGFNAVNHFLLIPEKEYYKAKEEVEKLIHNKTVIYLFEAESDFYKSNAKIIKNINFSNGEAVKLDGNGKAWQSLEIAKIGTYKLALKGSGDFKVSIGDTTFRLNTNSSNFTYTPMFNLEKGSHRLEVTPLSDNAVLDVVWLYSTETNQTIKQLFEVEEKPAQVTNYTKINPTLWKVKVNATKPFVLSFAESYDPLWEARVYKNGEKVEVVKSIPLYSIINGFWINETGDLEISIRYKPQDWFEIGLIISGLTFTGCIGYLFYDWRREKEDKWAKEIERKIKESLRRK